MVPHVKNTMIEVIKDHYVLGDMGLVNLLEPHWSTIQKNTIKDNDQVVFPRYSGQVGLISIDDISVLVFISDRIDLILAYLDNLEYDPSWLVQIVLHLQETGREPNHSTVLDARYKLLSFASFRSEYRVGDEYDLFVTLPPTSFASHLKKSSGENIGHVLTHLDISTVNSIISSAESLFTFLSIKEEENNEAVSLVIIELMRKLDQFKEELGRETVLIKINAFSNLVRAKLPEEVVAYIEDFGKEIKLDANNYGMESAIRILDAFTNWYLNSVDVLEGSDWDSLAIPQQVRLLPILVDLLQKSSVPSAKLQELIELNFKILADPIPYFGMEEFQGLMGRLHLEINDYANAETYFEYAAELYLNKGYPDLARQARLSALSAELEYFKELAVAANLFHFTGRLSESSTMGWSALTSATNVIREILELEGTDLQMTGTILEYFGRCKRPLVSDEDNEMTQVIELKLEELYNFIKSLADGSIPNDTAIQMVEMHIDSLKFLKPAKPARFMLMTNDGRLIDTQEAVAVPEEVSDSTLNHLMAGALTAIRSILQEATQSSGSVKEISAGDSVLLMEVKNDLVVVVSATNASDTLRRLVSEMAEEIQEKFGSVLKDWFGDSESIIPIRHLVRSKIESELL